MLQPLLIWFISWAVALITWLIGQSTDSVLLVLIHMLALIVLIGACMSIAELFFDLGTTWWIVISMLAGIVSCGLVYLVAHFIER